MNALTLLKTLSTNGLELLKGEEQCKLKPYRDGPGYSIGWGHFIKPDEPELMKGIRQTKADALLYDDVEWATDAVNRYVAVRITQNQFDALVSLVYNIGETHFRTSTLLRLLNAGKRRQAADQFKLWRISNGKVNPVLVARRAREKALFLTKEVT